MRTIAALCTLILALGVVQPAQAAGERAYGTLVDGTGSVIGTVILDQMDRGVMINVLIRDDRAVRPGAHGIHLHAVGSCDGPAFTTAGGHFNPTDRQHGALNPAGSHAGDLPNFVVGPRTTTRLGIRYQAVGQNVTLTGGLSSLFDADGTALVIHADPDDEATDPTGNSGARVACAVLVRAPGWFPGYDLIGG